MSGFADHLHSPRGLGGLRDWPHAGAAGGAACGDLVRIAVRVEAGVVAEAGFDASGCGSATAAASAAVTLAEGRPVLEVALLDADALSAELGGLSPSKRHAAVLAADALHRALGAAAGSGAIELDPDPRRVLVAMSGGVDSAVAAQLALEAGHEVVAVTLELWADPEGDGTQSCCSPHAVVGARALAQRMGIPHFTVDMRSEFRREVVEDFLSEHAAGRTPNPCVRCNGRVRFDGMVELAGRLGATCLATGHYARVAGGDAEGLLLRAAVDPDKDQTYMLAGLSTGLLPRLWFPLGELTKPRVRELARRAGLEVADKPESQDLCFLAGTQRDRFLERHGDIRGSQGQLVDLEGRVVGSHGGHQHFTIGQRRGLGISSVDPLYVVGKDPEANRIVVGPRSALATNSVELTGVRLSRPGATVDRVKLRYRQDPIPCRIDGDPGAGRHEQVTVALDRPVDGVAPGQTACLMHEDTVVGWAVIDGAGDRALNI
ncbi:MAG: tRNA-uridine 2-sulfurtransferase [Thermoleophilaceae bacterium]|nr:tRNA-uridine 2-sulfurtransferase [Thermoleophilaceae bacterium]